MMVLPDLHPSIITMENIIASGDFELISDFEYREKLIDTYNYYKTISQLEDLLSDYVNQYVIPFFFENIRFSDFSSRKENFILGYDVLLTQKLKGYEVNLEKLKQLNQLLTTANKGYTQ
jgi:hypothetical protein